MPALSLIDRFAVPGVSTFSNVTVVIKGSVCPIYSLVTDAYMSFSS